MVDVQQASRVPVLSREVLDNVINTGSPWTQAMMVPGVSMAGIDVGGSRYVNDLQLEARGANAKHTTVVQDGMALDLIALEGVPSCTTRTSPRRRWRSRRAAAAAAPRCRRAAS